ncbi:MAG: glycosyltransferase family 4 protein [Patescibacteria group bacterium]
MDAARKRKIAIVTPYGAQSRFDNYAEFILGQTLQERNWRVRFYTYAVWSVPAYRHSTTYKGLSVIRCRQRVGISPHLFFDILFTRPDVVICFHPKSFLNFTAYMAARLVGAKFVADIVGILHDPYIVNDTDSPEDNFKSPIHLVTDFRALLKDVSARRLKGLWTNYVCHMPTKHADAIVSMNTDEKKFVQMIYNRPSELIYWSTPRYMDYTESKPDADIPERFFLFIGQIKLRKGWDTALEAMARLKKEGKDDVHLVFVTPFKDMSEPIAYARKLDILSSVTFLSAVSNEEKGWLLTHCTYVLIPSRYEGFGLVVFEAFLAKKPVCATTIRSFLEFLEDRKNAMLYAPGDSEGLARAVITLDADTGLQKTLVEEGTRTAERFNYNRMVDAYVNLFDSLGRS